VEFSPVGRVCSFCGTIGTTDTKFAGGMGALMCLDCLNRYHDIFSSTEELAAIQRPPWESMSDSELLGQLPLIAASATHVQRFLADWVGLIRERGISWTAIGKALGISRQAAWERFTRPSHAKATSATG
jgi:hypothetical protein